MDRTLWMNRYRRTTFLGERRSGSSKEKSKNLSKPFGDLSVNKENVGRGLRRNILGARGLNSKNEVQQAKKVSSRRSITRRLSFQKTDNSQISEESPLICAGSYHDNCQDVDESMLFPLNSTAVMGSDPLPFRLDLLPKGEQKIGNPLVDKHLKSSKYGCAQVPSNKVVLSDETKEMLRQMGIETSPDAGAAKQDTCRMDSEKSALGIKTSDHSVKDAEINVQKQTTEIFGKSAPSAPNFLTNDKVEKDNQTTPKLLMDKIHEELPEKNGALTSLVMALEKIHLRQFQEREDLLRKQKKEIDEVLAKFRETNEGVLIEKNEKSSHGVKTKTCETQPESLTLGVGNDSVIPSIRMEVLSLFPAATNTVDSMRNLSTQLNSQKETFMALDNEEPPTEISNFLSPQGCILSGGSVVSQPNGNTGDISENGESAGANDKPVECSGLLNTQIWQRKQEVSLIDTPRAGSWLVEENLSSTSTPTLGLNSMLKGMSIQGQQTFMETPATRRLVTKRILQGVESLFV